RRSTFSPAAVEAVHRAVDQFTEHAIEIRPYAPPDQQALLAPPRNFQSDAGEPGEAKKFYRITAIITGAEIAGKEPLTAVLDHGAPNRPGKTDKPQRIQKSRDIMINSVPVPAAEVDGNEPLPVEQHVIDGKIAVNRGRSKVQVANLLC